MGVDKQPSLELLLVILCLSCTGPSNLNLLHSPSFPLSKAIFSTTLLVSHGVQGQNPCRSARCPRKILLAFVLCRLRQHKTKANKGSTSTKYKYMIINSGLYLG